MNLSAVERKVAGYLEMRADQTMTEHATGLQLRTSTVNYYFNRLREKKVILARRAYIDFSRLGYTSYVTYFSSTHHRPQTKEKLIRLISSYPRASWAAEIGGPWQYAVSVAVKSVNELSEFYTYLEKEQGSQLLERTLSVVSKIATFGRGYLYREKRSALTLNFGGGIVDGIDTTDQRVLAAVSELGFDSHRELARRYDIPFSTFERRLEALTQRGIMQGFYYVLDPSCFGMQQFRLLIRLNAADTTIRGKLGEWTRYCLQARKYLETFGPWDIEIEVEVDHYSKLTAITAQLYDEFSTAIKELQTIPLFRHINCPAWRIT